MNTEYDVLKNNFRKRNIDPYFAKDEKEAEDILFTLIEETMQKEGKDKSSLTVSKGGSVTLDEMKIPEKLKEKGYNYINPRDFTSEEEQKDARKRALVADVFLTGTNAVTVDGILVNIDGYGSRVAPLICGPDTVIIVVGKNKIVSDVKQAYKRIKEIACPKNCIRLSKKTPCAQTGKCGNCLINNETICSHTVITRRFSTVGRAKIIIIDKIMGY